MLRRLVRWRNSDSAPFIEPWLVDGDVEHAVVAGRSAKQRGQHDAHGEVAEVEVEKLGRVADGHRAEELRDLTTRPVVRVCKSAGAKRGWTHGSQRARGRPARQCDRTAIRAGTAETG